MSDPLSLTLTLITAFKEVYLLSRCIYQACETAKASEDERSKLRHDIRFELVYLQSFGRYYLSNGSIAEDTKLDRYWIPVIRDIFERLRKTFSDYSKLDEPKYIEFSPYLNDRTYDTPLIEFDIDEEIPAADSTSIVENGTKTTTIDPKTSKANNFTSLFARSKTKPQAVTHSTKPTAAQRAFSSAKWVLYEKERLEQVVVEFRKETQKLKDCMVMAQSSRFAKVDRKLDAIEIAIKSDDAGRLGLVPHAKLIQLNEEEKSANDEDYNIKNRTISIDGTQHELTTGHLSNNMNGTDPDPESILVELKRYPPSAENSGLPDAETVANVQRLAGLLKISSSVLRTLPFQGFINQPEQQRYAFIYNYPSNAAHSRPVSLYTLITSDDPKSRFSLKNRFDVAQKLAQSIGVFHTDKWVHKSVCSQSIVFFEDRVQKTIMLDSPYLVDFEYSRPERGRTYVSYNNTTEATSLYLHPDRPRMTFTKLHDIYALGVVLLELATWTSAEQRFRSALQVNDLDTASIGKEEVRERFIAIAKSSIPYYMGTSYMEAVVACLDDTYRGQTGGVNFPQIFQREIVEKLSAKNLL